MISKSIKNRLYQQIKAEEKLLQQEKREKEFEYLGLMETYQLYGNKDFCFQRFNDDQRFKFMELLHGYGAYTPEELGKLSHNKKKKITKLYKKAQRLINIFKQEVCNLYARRILSNFKECEAIALLPIESTDESYFNQCTLKELGLDYDHLTLLFIQNKLLPSNFLNG